MLHFVFCIFRLICNIFDLLRFVSFQNRQLKVSCITCLASGFKSKISRDTLLPSHTNSTYINMADRNWFNCIKHFLCCSRDLFIDPNQQKCWQTLTKFNERLGHTYSTYISIADSPQFFADQSPHKAKIFLKSYAEEFPEMCSLLWEYSEIFYFCFTFSASYRILYFC